MCRRETRIFQQIANLFLDEVDELGVRHHVNFVQKYHDIRNTHLTSQEDVLARLRHGAVGCGNNQNRTVHLRGAGNHVLDVVSVTRTVDVRVVARLALVFDVRGVDGNAACLFFRSGVDLVDRLVPAR